MNRDLVHSHHRFPARKVSLPFRMSFGFQAQFDKATATLKPREIMHAYGFFIAIRQQRFLSCGDAPVPDVLPSYNGSVDIRFNALPTEGSLRCTAAPPSPFENSEDPIASISK